MFEPMFEPPAATFIGVPVAYVLLAAAAILAIIGVRWMLRIIGADPEPQSFYATADRGIGPSWHRIIAIAIAGLVLIGAGFMVVILTSGPGGLNVNDLLLGAGGLLEAVAVAFGVRRVWYRARR